MARRGRGVIAFRDDQLTAAQGLKGDLDCTLGKACRVGKRSYARRNRFPSLPRGLSVKIDINQIRSRLLIVPDQIAHQDIENVIIDGNGLFEARHRGK